MNSRIIAPSASLGRRQFLKVSAGVGAVLAAGFPTPLLAKQQPLVLRFASQQPVNSIYTQAMTMFGDEVSKLSSDKIKIENYPSSQLGDATQMMTSVQLGSLSMAIATPAWYSRFVPQTDVFTLPYIVASSDRLRGALNGQLGQHINGLAEAAGLHFMGGYLMGSRNLVNNTRAINTPDDVKGLKIRVIGSKVYLQTFSMLGGNPIAMDSSELYLALQQHVLDGFEYPLPDLLDYKLYEVSKYLSLDDHNTDFFIISMNKGVWSNMASEQQQMVTQALNKSIDWQWTTQPANVQTALTKLRTLMTVNDLTPEARQKFADMTRPVYSQFQASIGKDLLDLAVKELGPA